MKLFWIAVINSKENTFVVPAKAIFADNEAHAMLLAGRDIPINDKTPADNLVVHVSPF